MNLTDQDNLPPFLKKRPSTNKFPEGQPVIPRLVHVVINPAAGQEQPVLGTLNSAFRENEIEWDAFVTHEAGDARRFAQKSVEAGADVVMVCGGDGTIMEAASGLVGTGVPMAIIPCGTANVMSVELAIPGDIREAIALVTEGRNTVRGVDMGTVNNVEFLLRVGVGMEARMVMDTPRESKTRWGNLAYFVTALNQLQNPDVTRYTLKLDGLHVEVDGISLMVANSVNIGLPGINLVQNTSVSDGLLDVIVIRRVDLPALVAIATNTLLSLADEPEPLLHWQAREIQVESDPAQPAQADGEILPDSVLNIKTAPKAVSIVCPEPFPGQNPSG